MRVTRGMIRRITTFVLAFTMCSTLLLPFTIRVKAAEETWGQLPIEKGTGVRIHETVTDYNGTVYVATQNFGLFKQEKNTSDWIPINVEKGLLNFYSLFIEGDMILTGSSSGIYRSEDLGKTWQKTAYAGGAVMDDNTVYSFATYNGRYFASSTANNGIYISDDEGKTWTLKSGSDGIGSVSAAHKVNVVYAAPGSAADSLPPAIIVGTHTATAAAGHIYISYDNGETFRNGGPGTSVSYRTFTTGKNGVIFAGTESIFDCQDGTTAACSRIYSSKPAGVGRYDFLTEVSTYSATSPHGDVMDAVTDAYDNIYFATSHSGIYKSSDNGATWTVLDLNNGLPELYIDSLSYDSATDTLYAGTAANGIYKSTDAGQSWSYYGIPVITILSIVEDGNDLYVGTEGRGIYKSTDGGSSWDLSWQLIHPGTNVYDVAVGSSGVFAVTDWHILKLDKASGDWSDVRSGGVPVKNTAVIVDSSGKVYVGSLANVYTSADGGTSWTDTSTGLPANAAILDFMEFNGEIYAATVDGVYKISTSGGSWALVGSGLSGRINTLNVDVNGIIYAGTENGEIYKLDGNNWSQVNTAFGSAVNSLASSGTKDIIYAATASNGVYKSTDRGVSWIATNDGMGDFFGIYDLYISGDQVYAGTNIYGLYLADSVPGVPIVTPPVTTTPQNQPPTGVGSSIYSWILMAGMGLFIINLDWLEKQRHKRYTEN